MVSISFRKVEGWTPEEITKLRSRHAGTLNLLKSPKYRPVGESMKLGCTPTQLLNLPEREKDKLRHLLRRYIQSTLVPVYNKGWYVAYLCVGGRLGFKLFLKKRYYSGFGDGKPRIVINSPGGYV